MKKLSLFITLVLVGLMFIGGTQASAQKKSKKDPILMAAEDLKWEQLAGAPPGIMSVLLKGNPNKGEYDGLTKFPAGFKAPLHHHTYRMEIVVIKGAYIYKGKKYGPGSYLSIPGGDMHESGGAEDSETIFFIEQPGKFDLIPAEAAPDKK